MPTENLENLVKIGQLKVEPPADTERRNLAEYEGSYEIDEQTVEALIRVAAVVAERVQGLLE